MAVLTVNGAIQQVITTVKAIEGIKYAPEYPPEDIGPYFPFVTAYTTGGEWNTITAGFDQALFDIVLELHVAREGDLPHEVEKAMAYSDSVPEALLADQSLSDTVSHFERITYTFGVMNYGTTKTLGFRFVLEGVKIH